MQWKTVSGSFQGVFLVESHIQIELFFCSPVSTAKGNLWAGSRNVSATTPIRRIGGLVLALHLLPFSRSLRHSEATSPSHFDFTDYLKVVRALVGAYAVQTFWLSGKVVGIRSM